jgi:hypothetical protein
MEDQIDKNSLYFCSKFNKVCSFKSKNLYPYQNLLLLQSQ